MKLPHRFSFKSNLNPIGITYRAFWNGMHYIIEWEGGLIFKTTRRMMEERIENGDYQIIPQALNYTVKLVVKEECNVYLEGIPFEVHRLYTALEELENAEGGTVLEKSLRQILESKGFICHDDNSCNVVILIEDKRLEFSSFVEEIRQLTFSRAEEVEISR